MTVVVGTAGHIDHGKTTLLRALTGIDADRLPEEQRRGMTIDVGYAHLSLDDGRTIDFVDVPGHDRLVGNMLVGAGEIDAAILVVAADDGPRAQTLEHLELLDGLRITAGIAVVTKVDLVPADRAADVASAVRDLLDGTSLAGLPVIAASGASGHGLDAVRRALVAIADRAEPDAAGGPVRLAIDRVFSVTGRGVVVTGSLRGARITAGDQLRLEPGGRTVRVRELQVHGAAVAGAAAGRTAINLAGVGASDLHRGMVLTTDRAVTATDRWLVALRPVPGRAGGGPSLPHDRSRARLHVGTDQVDAAVGRAGREAVVLPTGEVTALLRLDRPVAVAAGDRFVLRRPSPARTEAGGRVLDPVPPRGVARRRITPERLAALAGAASAESRDRARLDLHGAVADAASVRLASDVAAVGARIVLERVRKLHLLDTAAPGVPLATLRPVLVRALRRLVNLDDSRLLAAAEGILDGLVADGQIVRDGGVVRDPSHAAPALAEPVLAAMGRLETALDVPAPPSLAEAARASGCPPAGIRALEEEGRLIRVDDDLAWAAGAWRWLARTALDLAGRGPLTPAALRDATGTSRKYVMALLEDLDRRQILRRTPAGHVPGPRAMSLEPVVATVAGQ